MSEVDYTAIYTFKCVELQLLERTENADPEKLKTMRREVNALEARLRREREKNSPSQPDPDQLQE